MKLLLLYLFLSISTLSISQYYLKPTIYPPTVGNSDGALKVELVGYSGAVDYEMSSLPFIPATSTDSLGGIAYSSGAGPLVLAYALEPLTGDTLMTLLIALSEQVSEIEFVSVLSPMTDISCDGSILMNHTYNLGVASDFDYSLYTDVSTFPGTTTGSLFGVNNLCEYGYIYQIESITNGVLCIIGFSLDALTPSLNNPTYTANVFSSISDTSICTSTSYALVNGNTPPYQYSWDGGAYSAVDTFPTICPGMHVLRIVDNLNDTLGMNFGVVDSSQYFQNSNLGPGPVIDTISFNTQNCSFDYNLAVDSTMITYFEEIDTNTIYFEMNIWQGGSLLQISDTVSCTYTQTGNNLFSLTLYCGTKATGGKIFQIIDYVNTSTSSTEEIGTYSQITVSPNPSNGSISIKMNDFKNVHILNVTGEEIANFEKSEINLSHLPKGTYFLSIQNVHGTIFSKRIILN